MGKVTAGLKTSGKVNALKDSIVIIWKDLGWDECETRWTVHSHKLTMWEMANRLKDLIQ